MNRNFFTESCRKASFLFKLMSIIFKTNGERFEGNRRGTRIIHNEVSAQQTLQTIQT